MEEYCSESDGKVSCEADRSCGGDGGVSKELLWDAIAIDEDAGEVG